MRIIVTFEVERREGMTASRELVVDALLGEIEATISDLTVETDYGESEYSVEAVDAFARTSPDRGLDRKGACRGTP